jgi:hypothetical protein
MKSSNKNGIEVRFGKGRSMKVLSYAVWINGGCHVSHETTRASRLAGSNLVRHLEIERAHYPELRAI